MNVRQLFICQCDALLRPSRPHSHVLGARRLQRPHQPFSDWIQEHPHHHQHGVAELGRRVSEEEARR